MSYVGNRPFLSSCGSLFQNESKCKLNLSYENDFCMQFHFNAIQSHFRKNGFALTLAVKQRHCQGNSEMAYCPLHLHVHCMGKLGGWGHIQCMGENCFVRMSKTILRNELELTYIHEVPPLH